MIHSPFLIPSFLTCSCSTGMKSAILVMGPTGGPDTLAQLTTWGAFMKWPCESIKPGMSVLPPRSTSSCVVGLGAHDVLFFAGGDDTPAGDGDGLDLAAVVDHRDDGSAVVDDLGLFFG